LFCLRKTGEYLLSELEKAGVQYGESNIVVLSDRNLVKYTGHEFGKLVRDKFSAIPFLIHTGGGGLDVNHDYCDHLFEKKNRQFFPINNLGKAIIADLEKGIANAATRQSSQATDVDVAGFVGLNQEVGKY
jgi:hypothetical protein